jgi:hypothetical protein
MSSQKAFVNFFAQLRAGCVMCGDWAWLKTRMASFFVAGRLEASCAALYFFFFTPKRHFEN